MTQKKILGLLGLGAVGYLAWKRGLFGGATGALAQADAAQAIAHSGAEIDACGNSPAGTGARMYAIHGVESGQSSGPDARTAQIIGIAGGGAAQIAGRINPVAGAVVGIGTAIAGLVSLFSSSPPDPVFRLAIVEMPYAWAGRSNAPIAPDGSQTIYAIDRCGFLHELLQDFHAAGYIDRELVAVNWKIFQMLPIGSPIESATEIEAARMPRPADPNVIRRVLGNDARFYVGQNEHLFGPWDPEANTIPIPGSPAAWASYAGDYQPTQTPSAGEY